MQGFEGGIFPCRLKNRMHKSIYTLYSGYFGFSADGKEPGFKNVPALRAAPKRRNAGYIRTGRNKRGEVLFYKGRFWPLYGFNATGKRERKIFVFLNA